MTTYKECAVNTQSKAHATLSPSGAEKWMNCPGSVVLEQEHPESESSVYADEGTAAHHLLAYCIDHRADPKSLIGRLILVDHGRAMWANVRDPDTDTRRFFEVSGDMAGYVGAALDVIHSYVGPEGASIVDSEQRLPISHLTGEKDAWGTADVVVLCGGALHVFDLKYGKGVFVNAVENKQLRIYALAALEVYETFEEIHTVISVVLQPRMDNYTNEILTVEEIRAFGELVKIRAEICQQQLAGKDELVFNVGEHCHDSFCKARAECPALKEHAIRAAEEAIRAIDDNVANDELGVIAAMIPLAQKYFDQVQAKVTAEVLAGRDVPGFKAVLGREGNREWGDEGVVAELAKELNIDDVYETKLMSPTKVLKLPLKKDVLESFEELVVRKPASLTVVPESDKRPAVVVAPENDFENLES